MKRCIPIFILSLVIAFIAFDTLANPSAPVSLLVNGLSRPLAIGAHGQFSLSVRVPANTRASIYIPKLSNGNFTITESGKVLWPTPPQIKDPGVLTVSEDDSSIKYLTGAGHYRFSETPANSL